MFCSPNDFQWFVPNRIDATREPLESAAEIGTQLVEWTSAFGTRCIGLTHPA